MKKTKAQADVWNESGATPEDTTPQVEDKPLFKAEKETKPVNPEVDPGLLAFDLEGLMTDFPTATELMKFVFDETGYTLNLKGRSNKAKYQIALDTLNGIAPPEELQTKENPYLDKNDLVPTEPLKPVPARDSRLPPEDQAIVTYWSKLVPHPDPELRAQDAKVECCFRKYLNEMVSYEITGPMETRAIGNKVDKFGRERPEYIKWIDPRTGEQVVRDANGQVTPIGRRLKTLLSSMKVGKSDQWAIWIDREIIDVGADKMGNDIWGNG
jgi:hypothetical protein